MKTYLQKNLVPLEIIMTIGVQIHILIHILQLRILRPGQIHIQVRIRDTILLDIQDITGEVHGTTKD